MLKNKITTEDRFWAKVRKTNYCWNWVGSTGGGGYSSFGKNPKYSAHRYSYEIHKGKIPKGKWVLHTCDNKKCVNPKHLFLGDLKTNVADMVSKGRQSKGTDRHNAKLNPRKVLTIRSRYKDGETLTELARRFMVTIQCIQLVVKRINWKHV